MTDPRHGGRWTSLRGGDREWLWRNLGGFPARDPYRSIGVEPMLGRVFDLADAAETDCATIQADGTARWRLTIAARRRPEDTSNKDGT